MTLELQLFATFRQAVGAKTIERTCDSPSIRIGDLLAELEADYPDLDLLDADGGVQPYVSILIDGTDIVHLDGVDTTVTEGDRISLFPPVAGG